jgi:hypothetical protein
MHLFSDLARSNRKQVHIALLLFSLLQYKHVLSNSKVTVKNVSSTTGVFFILLLLLLLFCPAYIVAEKFLQARQFGKPHV